MEAIKVYIDTSIFISKNYNFDGNEFQALARWAKEDKVGIVLTEVTIQEVRSNISKDIDKAIQSIQKLRKEAKIFRNFEEIPSYGIFADIDQKQYEESLYNKFQSFLELCKVAVVNCSNADTDKIFRMYFAKKPPFGEGKKKSEFPDAFILSTLSSLAENESNNIYVVSQDKDFAEGVNEFDRLIYLSSLEEFLNKVVSRYERLAPLATNFLCANMNIAKQRIEQEFTNLGFYLSDQEGDVDDVHVSHISEFEIYLIDINNGYALFELTCTVSYTAHLSYDDLDTASYDSEEKVLIPWRKIDTVVDRKEIVESELIISFNNTEPCDFKIESVNITTPNNDVEISSLDDDWYK